MAIALLTSCQDEIALAPAASLFTAQPEMTDTTAIFRLAVANVPESSEAITFPVTLGGTAEKGKDYTISSEAFVFGGENPVDSIVVTTLNRGTDKTLSLSVSLPAGFEGGKYLTSEYTLHDKYAYVTFAGGYSMLADSTDVSFSLTDRKGKVKTIKDSVEIRLSVNREKSTATEGSDFVFSDSTRYVIREGGSDGALEIKSLNPSPAEGMDKIVLNMEFGEDYGAGEIMEMEISLLDLGWNVLDGKWTMDSLVTDAAFMEDFWKDTCTGYGLLPEFNERDVIGFDLGKALLEPELRSMFRNYFIGDSGMRKGPVIGIELSDGQMVNMQTFAADNTNRYFSMDEESEDKVSLIGMRLIPDGEEQLLDMYLIDHTSRSFMPELESSGKYNTEKPAAASPGLYINMILRNDR